MLHVSQGRHCFDADTIRCLRGPRVSLPPVILSPTTEPRGADLLRVVRWFPSPQASAAVVQVPRAGRAMPEVVNSLQWLGSWLSRLVTRPPNGRRVPHTPHAGSRDWTLEDSEQAG